MRKPHRAALVVLALASLALAGPGAVRAGCYEDGSCDSPIPGTLGLSITPAPIHLDDGVRAFDVANRSGGLVLSVGLVTEPSGYRVEPTIFDLAPGAIQKVTITAIDPAHDGTLVATASSDTPGTVRSSIALSTRLLHAPWYERVPVRTWELIAVGLVFVLASAWLLVRLRLRTMTDTTAKS